MLAAPTRGFLRLAVPALGRRSLHLPTGSRWPAAALRLQRAPPCCRPATLALPAAARRWVYSEAGALRARVDAEAALLDRIWGDDQTIELEDVLEVIDLNYNYTPTAFRNGAVENAADENVSDEPLPFCTPSVPCCPTFTRLLLHFALVSLIQVGSCKLLSWALLHNLNTDNVLLAFGRHYRDLDPDGTSHLNIRAIATMGPGPDGMAEVVFEGRETALESKEDSEA